MHVSREWRGFVLKTGKMFCPSMESAMFVDLALSPIYSPQVQLVRRTQVMSFETTTNTKNAAQQTPPPCCLGWSHCRISPPPTRAGPMPCAAKGQHGSAAEKLCPPAPAGVHPRMLPLIWKPFDGSVAQPHLPPPRARRADAVRRAGGLCSAASKFCPPAPAGMHPPM